MKLYKQDSTRLKKGGSSLKKSVSAVFMVRESVRDRTDGEEEGTKQQLAPWERHAWEKLSPRRRQRLMEMGRSNVGHPTLAPAARGRDALAAKRDGKQRQERKGAIPSGWAREKCATDVIEEEMQASVFPPARQKEQPFAAVQENGRGAGPTQQGPDMPDGSAGAEGMAGYGIQKKGTAAVTGKGGGAALGKTGTATAAAAVGKAGTVTAAAAAGPAGAGAAAAKKTAEKFRRTLELRQAADAQEQEALAGAGAAGTSGTDGSAASGGGKSTEGRISGTVVAVAGAMAAAMASTISSALPVLGAIVLAVLLLISAVIPIFDRTARNGTAILEVARQELEAADENIGGQKYKDWYGYDGAWCTMFVTWCADQCGLIEMGIVPKTASVAELHAWYEAKGLYHEKAGYVPMTGDIILFEGAGSSHTGLVEAYDAAASTVTVIEGNTRGGTPFDHHASRVTRNTYSLASPRITAFCSPDYPASFVELSGDSNAEMVYRAFVDAGYTPEASAAVAGNLAAEAGTDADDDIIINSVQDGGKGPGIGICQWTSEGRKAGFLAYARERGEPWPDTGLAVQLEYMMKELSSNIWIWTAIGAEYGEQYHISHAEFKASTDVAFATTAFCANFERCHAANANLGWRIEYAGKVLASFGDYRPGTGGEAQEEEGQEEEAGH